MRKIAAYLVLGLIAGFAIAKLGGTGSERTAADDGGLERRLDRLEAALADERSARLRLEAAIAAEPSAPTAGAQAVSAAPGPEAPGVPVADAGRRPDAAVETAGPPRRGGRAPGPDLGQRLLDGGFTPERSAYIVSRTEALRLEALEARYAAQRDGDPGGFRALPNLQRELRSELGDAEYEQYLAALGLPTSIEVDDVLSNSPAAQAGFQAGDRIVGYGGARVFDMGELNRLTLDGDPGTPVAVDVIRDGQTIQLYLPRGPLGITGGRGFGRRP